MEETLRLFWQDPTMMRFDATVVDRLSDARGPVVVVDQTAFYPEGGGQLSDRGLLGGQPVIDVQTAHGGVIHHVLDENAPSLSIGETVNGSLDVDRRREHMALHTAQHMLSRALERELGAHTVSARLGASAATVDVDTPDLCTSGLARIETQVNRLVDDDLAVKAWFPGPDELARLNLRRASKKHEGVRVVAIGDFDVTPCGGTHCTRTAQVGLIRIEATERYKGGTRLTFSAGRRARKNLGHSADMLGALALHFQCAPSGIEQAIARLRSDLESAQQRSGRLQALLASELVEKRSGNPWVAHWSGLGRELLRAVATRATSTDDRVAIIASADGQGWDVVVRRGPGSDFDCAAFMALLRAEAGGRGGGRPSHAEGRLPLSVRWPDVVFYLLETGS